MNNAVAMFNNRPSDLLLTEMNEICIHNEDPMLIQFRKKSLIVRNHTNTKKHFRTKFFVLSS